MIDGVLIFVGLCALVIFVFWFIFYAFSKMDLNQTASNP